MGTMLRGGMVWVAFGLLAMAAAMSAWGQPDATIPLPEHPRPDFQRANWINLNGQWTFQFGAGSGGQPGNWTTSSPGRGRAITVPFSWGSPLSGVADEGDIGWYKRTIIIPEDWDGGSIFVVVGASDWHTTAWIDGYELGSHQGGYTPFEFDLTDHVQPGGSHILALRVDDTPHPFKLLGKQGYGRAAGIWQTIYLERRPYIHVKTVHFTPDIDEEKVTVRVTLSEASVGAGISISSKVDPPAFMGRKVIIQPGEVVKTFDLPLEEPRLWSLDDPYLYDVEVKLMGPQPDPISTYFGMRKISVVNLPGTSIPYIALNDKPVYLQLALDQSYHPEGYYTFPSDDFMRDEILRSRRIGLNGQRIHIKAEIPRKLYWADRLGILIMADVPNSWGGPDEDMRRETEVALRGMIERDYNHPSIFSWVNFNESWGLRERGEDGRGYTKETQDWVASIYKLTKELDPTRLVEDNSTNNHDHVATDINSWHAYLPGYRWTGLLDRYTALTYPGSEWNFIGGNVQGNQPIMNSECGNVWGYESERGGGPAGDMDWSWDYHLMMNAFRRHPVMCGWLYTEHHDVVNEWNGYYRYDRTKRYTGIPELAPGMALKDLHSPFYIAMEEELCREVAPGETIETPLYASFMTDAAVGPELTLRSELYGWDAFGKKHAWASSSKTIAYKPWMTEAIDPLSVTMPSKPGVAVLAISLSDSLGNVLHRNFTTYLVSDGPLPRDMTIDSKTRVVRFAPDSFFDAEWSYKQWNVLDGLKVNGAGAGYFEYRVPWPKDLEAEEVTDAALLMEVSAKRLNGNDREGATHADTDFMLGEGTHDPSSSPNSYPMTDERPFPSAVTVRVAGEVAVTTDLPDDPADHQGILSWFSQPRDVLDHDDLAQATSFRAFKGGILHEAGSYGYLVQGRISAEALAQAQAEGFIRIRLESDDALSGGLAIYGERFGRYPMDPTLVFSLK